MKKHLSKLLLGLSLVILTAFVYKVNLKSSYSIVNQELQTYNTKVINAGGSLCDYDLKCYDSLITNLKTKNVWSKIYELATFDGGYSSSLIKLKYYTYDTCTKYYFTSSDYDTLNGYSGNASNKWIDCNYDLSNTDLFSFSFGVYSQDDGSKGALAGASNNGNFYMCYFNSEGRPTNCYAAPSLLETCTRRGLASITSNMYGCSVHYNGMVRYEKNSVGTAATKIGGGLNLFRYNGSNYSNGKISLYFFAKELSSLDIKILGDEIEKFYINIGRRSIDRFVVLGDSETWGQGATSKAYRWTSILADSLNMEEVNCGVIGTLLQYNTSISSSGRARFIGEILPHKPKKTYLALSLNDVLHNAGTINNFSDQLRYIITYLKASGIDSNSIYVLTPAYVNPLGYAGVAPFNGGSVAKHVQFKDSVIAISASLGVKSIDIYTELLNNGGNSLIGSDKIHPNNSGYLRWANKAYLESK